MGNTSSSSSTDTDRLRHFSRTTGSLGLSRQQLDKACQPSGLYGDCQWDAKAIRRFIGDGRIAPRLKGEECSDNACGATEECPICFLLYTEVNKTTCCNANMCTECYLQVRPQKEKQSTCPFCNCDDFSVVLKKKTKSDVERVAMCTSESTKSLSDSSGCSSTNSNGNSKKKSVASVAPDTPKTGFGSELEKDERFKRMKERSESFHSSDGRSTPKKEKEIIQSIAMTANERQRLEEEMKAQHNHPLVLQLEAEEQERRLEHDRAYQSTHPSINASTGRGYHIARRTRATRNWDQFTMFFDPREELDEMSALETAILYSRLAAAGEQAEASEEQRSAETNNGARNRNMEQMEGFPLLRSLLTGQLDSTTESASSGRSSNLRTSRRQRNPLMRSGLGGLSMRPRGGMGNVALETASMMIQGISEEEQIAMAIAASMQDQQTVPSDDNDDENDDNDGDNDSDDDDDNDDDADDDNESNESEGSSEVDTSTSNSENSDEVGLDSSEDSSSSPSIPQIPEAESEPLMQQGSGDEASTITELASVVTDTHTPNSDTIPNGIASSA